MYYHWRKQRDADGPCTEMTGFTRLCASKGGEPDGLEAHIPSVFVPQLTTEVLAKYGHFGVLNRPHSVEARGTASKNTATTPTRTTFIRIPECVGRER